MLITACAPQEPPENDDPGSDPVEGYSSFGSASVHSSNDSEEDDDEEVCTLAEGPDLDVQSQVPVHVIPLDAPIDPVAVENYLRGDLDAPIFCPPEVEHPGPQVFDFALNPVLSSEASPHTGVPVEEQIRRKMRKILSSVYGRDRREALLGECRELLLLVAPEKSAAILAALPKSWSTFAARCEVSDSAREPRRASIYHHTFDVTGLGQVQRTVTISTADPLPRLLRLLYVYQEYAYFGRGASGEQPVNVDKLWTTENWRRISAGVPSDGVPLMISMYSDAFNAAGRNHHPIM
jgi:hypothetical protein